eukprot:TRINITY_DN21035_c0_g2_i1.p1 TRINITY_DN21035_c0_g2~~TRINITY_DN21035_c0_g2_i1.p1  ORF type:complete len:119 (+),score=13.52 TRINITY_DN21035_c0_g2_i1:303-659(+)
MIFRQESMSSSSAKHTITKDVPALCTEFVEKLTLDKKKPLKLLNDFKNEISLRLDKLDKGKSINMVVETPNDHNLSKSNTDESNNQSDESDDQSIPPIPQIHRIFTPKTHTSKTKKLL